MIPFACNFAFSLWGKKIFAAPFLILDMIYIKSKPVNTAHSERGQKHGDLLTNSSPSMILLMPSECYISFLCFFFLSLSSLDPSEVEVGVTGRRPSCWGYCSGQGGPSSSGYRLLHRWRCGYRASSPPAWHRHRCCGRWTAWRARCWKSAWARGRLTSTPGREKTEGERMEKVLSFFSSFFTPAYCSLLFLLSGACHCDCQGPNSIWVPWRFLQVV